MRMDDEMCGFASRKVLDRGKAAELKTRRRLVWMAVVVDGILAVQL